MKTYLWTVDFNNNFRMYVSAPTVLIAIKNAIWGYNKDMNESIKSSSITAVRLGKFED